MESIFYSPYEKRDEAAAAKKRFIHYEGDHLTLLRLFKCYLDFKGDNSWCQDHFINHRSMKHVMEIHHQLMEFASRLKLLDPANDVNEDAQNHSNPKGKEWMMEQDGTLENTIPLRKCILSGFFHHTALLQNNGTYKTLLTKQVI